MTPLGLSSGSLPAARAGELLDCLRRLELDTLDLRWGKGHGWEPDGLAPFADGEVRVAFVGAGLVLGRSGPDWSGQVQRLADLLAPYRPLPVKVFGDSGLDGDDPAAWSLAAEQVDALTRAGGCPPLVETHHGYAGPAALRRLCAELGCRLLLDVGGYFRLTGGFADPDGLVGAHATAVQVKGFAPGDPGTHRPLAELPEPGWALTAAAGPGAPVTIESRSGTLAADAATLHARYPRHTRTGG